MYIQCRNSVAENAINAIVSLFYKRQYAMAEGVMIYRYAILKSYSYCFENRHYSFYACLKAVDVDIVWRFRKILYPFFLQEEIDVQLLYAKESSNERYALSEEEIVQAYERYASEVDRKHRFHLYCYTKLAYPTIAIAYPFDLDGMEANLYEQWFGELKDKIHSHPNYSSLVRCLHTHLHTLGMEVVREAMDALFPNHHSLLLVEETLLEYMYTL